MFNRRAPSSNRTPFEGPQGQLERESMPQQLPRVSVIVPARNEEKNLYHVLPRIPSWVHEVVLVDGHSNDRTVEVAEQLNPKVRVVHQQGRGKGDALRLGFEAATGDVLVTVDADGSMDPAEMYMFVGALLAGADYVKGSRFMQGGGTDDMSLTRAFGNWVFTTTVKVLFGGRFTDLCYGYNAFWRRALPKVSVADGFEVETVMNVSALAHGLAVVEVPSFERQRVYGASNLHALRDGWRILKAIFQVRLKLIGKPRAGSRRVGPRQAAAHAAADSWFDKSPRLNPEGVGGQLDDEE